MRSISGALAAAQKARVRKPFLQFTIADRFAGIRRLRWTQWYAGAEPDKGHAAIVAGDGSLIRARFDGTTLYRSRVTSPAVGSTYSSWTAWTPPVTPAADLIAFAKAGSTLWALIVNNAAKEQVYTSTSADDGATWSAFALGFTLGPGNITALAARVRQSRTAAGPPVVTALLVSAACWSQARAAAAWTRASS